MRCRALQAQVTTSIMNCNFCNSCNLFGTTHNIYMYDEIYVVIIIQKLSCKTNYKTPFSFFHNDRLFYLKPFLVILGYSTLHYFNLLYFKLFQTIPPYIFLVFFTIAPYTIHGYSTLFHYMLFSIILGYSILSDF